jgi:hypothetical protein
VLQSYIVKGFYIKKAVLGDFSIKIQELPPVCGCVLVYSDRLGVIYDPQPHGYALFLNKTAVHTCRLKGKAGE